MHYVNGEAIGLAAAAAMGQQDGTARLAQLFEHHHGRLYRLARRMTSSGDEAADLVQETFLRIARRPLSVPDGAPAEEAWLVRVLVNLCRDDWRRRGVRRRLDPQHVEGGPRVMDPEAPFVAHDTIWRALRELTPRRRAAIVMYELEGTSIARIATVLGISAVTVRWHLSRGRQELARIISTTTRQP